ncbi:unnamed protein product [Miscanthus lutarioriparius]|uniref:Guanylate kinase-like domain-containing protein n=1 Tax=Miscanthus lutarioriparius TaxID=422564 RepID=A0A811MER1_9POAL|nr:unnamed protein product [Miscanthus lutarioriparius]
MSSSSAGWQHSSHRPPPPPPPPHLGADKDQLFRGLEAALGTTFSSEPLAPPPQPMILVISGPSGVGKDAVIKRLQEERKDPFRCHRNEQGDEASTNNSIFCIIAEKCVMALWIRDYMAKGCDIVLRVDIQGASTLRQILGESAVFIFLVAESEEALVKRLIHRKTETSDMLLVRVATAREEVKRMKNFDYVVVNAEGKLEEAVKQVESIIDAEKAKIHKRHVNI